MIEAKRGGERHDAAELEAFVAAYLAGDVPDYQMSAWLMAVCWRGMDPAETAEFTEVLANSGDRLDLSSLPNTVDKHSTGGVGDKTTLVLAPVLAACGGTVAKVSGRGLGHTGGTVDKLESIPGFRACLDDDAFLQQARDVGVVVTGQSKDLAPADGALYALRDVTGTVASLPLIASSIMSKKLAGGAASIVLDVKVGSGAFMPTETEARALAESMIDIGRRAGRNVRALLTDMSQPLGRAVGNALEVDEAWACLTGSGPDDLRELVVALAGEVLEASGLDGSPQRVARALDDGSAAERFRAWIEAQGGDPSAVGSLPRAPGDAVVTAPATGIVARLDALAVGEAVKLLGGGRAAKGEAIDPGVGAIVHARVGDRVEAGAPLIEVRHRDGRGLEAALARLAWAVEVGDEAVGAVPLILGRVA